LNSNTWDLSIVSSQRQRLKHVLIGTLMCCVCMAAHAQVRLPAVQLPTLPDVQLPIDARVALGGILNVDTRQLQQLRVLQVHELIRANRHTLEADPHGEAILRNELLAYSPTTDAIEKARGAGFSVLRQSALESFDVTLVVLSAPKDMPTAKALRKLRDLDPAGVYDFNHVYSSSGESSSPIDSLPSRGASAESADATVKVGLIDGGVERAHQVFKHVSMNRWGCGGAQVTSAHGTAVASILVGHAGAFHGAAPEAQLYAADVYCGVATGGAVDTIAAAFAWLSNQHVPVINVSLVGPKNVTLEQVVRVMIARGHIIVAAVGNDGPSAPPLYPAAYAGVIGVTAVDKKQRVLIEACRGSHVAFAAPGADMATAGANDAYVVVRGTSFAAPIVAGLLAKIVHEPSPAQAQAAIAALSQQAVDLGARGRDKIFGNGLVGIDARIDPALVAAARP
jgi:subtilisin family serine protease